MLYSRGSLSDVGEKEGGGVRACSHLGVWCQRVGLIGGAVGAPMWGLLWTQAQKAKMSHLIGNI